MGREFISGTAEFGGGGGRLCVRMGALLVMENRRSGKDTFFTLGDEQAQGEPMEAWSSALCPPRDDSDHTCP